MDWCRFHHAMQMKKFEHIHSAHQDKGMSKVGQRYKLKVRIWQKSDTQFGKY